MIGWRASRRRWNLSNVSLLEGPREEVRSAVSGALKLGVPLEEAASTPSFCRGEGPWVRGGGDGTPGGADSRWVRLFENTFGIVRMSNEIMDV